MEELLTLEQQHDRAMAARSRMLAAGAAPKRKPRSPVKVITRTQRPWSYPEALAVEAERERAAKVEAVFHNARDVLYLATGTSAPSSLRAMRAIVATVSVVSGVAAPEIYSHRKEGRVSKARQIAVWLCRRFALTERSGKEPSLKSLPEIGRHFGGRDHSTILHACRKLEAVIALVGAPADDTVVEAWAAHLWAARWPRGVLG